MDSNGVSGEDAQPTAGLLARLGAGGTVAAVAALVVIVVLVSSLGSDDTPAEVALTTAPPQAAPSTTEPDRPQVAPIDTCTLLPDSAVDAALGLVDDDGNAQSERALRLRAR